MSLPTSVPGNGNAKENSRLGWIVAVMIAVTVLWQWDSRGIQPGPQQGTRPGDSEGSASQGGSSYAAPSFGGGAGFSSRRCGSCRGTGWVKAHGNPYGDRSTYEPGHSCTVCGGDGRL